MADAHVTNFARIDFRNDDRMFGIKDEDRFSHVYIIGKTGTGKSTLIETMALRDIERGLGCAVIDPHGDGAHFA
jgi:type IV secretory pathway VirB4 component